MARNSKGLQLLSLKARKGILSGETEFSKRRHGITDQGLTDGNDATESVEDGFESLEPSADQIYD
jgi:hypothetical protein